MNEVRAGRDDAMVPPDVMVREVLLPVLDVLTSHRFLARMTISLDGPYQIDVIKVVGVMPGETEERAHYTYELYDWEETPRVRHEIDDLPIGGWHETPRAAFHAGLSVLTHYLATPGSVAPQPEPV